LLDHSICKCENTLFAELHELSNAEDFDIELGFEAEFLLDLYLNP